MSTPTNNKYIHLTAKSAIAVLVLSSLITIDTALKHNAEASFSNIQQQQSTLIDQPNFSTLVLPPSVDKFDQVSVPEIKLINDPEIMRRELRCLAEGVYFEARGESEEGKLAVAHVIVNRTKDEKFPSTVCGVIYQKVNQHQGCQFSWTCSKKRPKIDTASPEWKDSIDAATAVLTRSTPDNTKGALFFHSIHVQPKWKNSRYVARIGNHKFYK